MLRRDGVFGSTVVAHVVAGAELEVPIAIHPTYDPLWAIPARFRHMGREREFFYNVMGRQGSQQAFLSFFTMGTLERFPSLKLGVLEVGCGWIGSFLDRMDAVYETIAAKGVGITKPPSEYFRRQGFISMDPDDECALAVLRDVGTECVVWASDYPHTDHDFPGAVKSTLEILTQGPPGAVQQVLDTNPRRLYRLPAS